VPDQRVTLYFCDQPEEVCKYVEYWKIPYEEGEEEA
jgi:hypothetical protein